MPTADGPDPVLWVTIPDDERGEVYAAWQMEGVRARRAAHLRHMQWDTEAGRNGERAEVLDAAFDELEVAR